MSTFMGGHGVPQTPVPLQVEPEFRARTEGLAEYQGGMH